MPCAGDGGEREQYSSSFSAKAIGMRRTPVTQVPHAVTLRADRGTLDWLQLAYGPEGPDTMYEGASGVAQSGFIVRCRRWSHPERS